MEHYGTSLNIMGLRIERKRERKERKREKRRDKKR